MKPHAIILSDATIIDVETERDPDPDPDMMGLDVPSEGRVFLRVSVPMAHGRRLRRDSAWHLLDQTLDVSLSTRVEPTPSGGWVDVRLEAAGEERDRACLSVLRKAFPGDGPDSRFPALTNGSHEELLVAWMGSVGERLVAYVRGHAAGFLEVIARPEGQGHGPIAAGWPGMAIGGGRGCDSASVPGTPATPDNRGAALSRAFIRLAATDPEHRMVGVASALYGAACDRARAMGCASLGGRISSTNVAVMNIYASLGGRFSNPRDVLVREVYGPPGRAPLPAVQPQRGSFGTAQQLRIAQLHDEQGGERQPRARRLA